MTPAVLGCLSMLAGTVFFSCMHATVRIASEHIDPLEVMFFRNLFGLVVILPWFFRHGITLLYTSHIKLHMLRALLNVMAMSLFFVALTLTPLAKVQTLTFTAPIFTMLLAAPLLGERISRGQWVAVAVAALGTILVLRPGVVPIDTGSLLVIGSASIWGLTMIVIKRLSATDSAVTITAWMVLLMTVLSSIPAAVVWTTPQGMQWVWLLAAGILGTLAQMLLTQSFRLADASLVLPIDFTKVIWGAAIGWFAFGEFVHVTTWVGAVIIFATACWITLNGKKQGPKSEG